MSSTAGLPLALPISYITNAIYILGCIVHTVSGWQHEDTADCNPNSSLCYKDCCLKGEWFCNRREERCSHCSIRQSLCGNDSLPVECLLYCYKRSHPDGANPGPDLYFVAFVVAVILATILIAVVSVSIFCVRGKPIKEWPSCFRALLRLPVEDAGRKDQPDTDQQHSSNDTENVSVRDLLLTRKSSVTSTQPSGRCSTGTFDNVQDMMSITSVDTTGTNDREQTRPEASEGQNRRTGKDGKPLPQTAQYYPLEDDQNIGQGRNYGPASPGSVLGAPTPCGGVPSNGAGHADQALRPGHQLDAKPSPSGHNGQACFVPSKPNFSEMNPTNGPGTQCNIITTGTTNPAKNFQEHIL